MKIQVCFFFLLASSVFSGYAQSADAPAPETSAADATAAVPSESQEISALKGKISRQEDVAAALACLAELYQAKGDYEGLRQYLKTLPEAGLGETPEVYLALAKAGAAQIEHWQKTKDWEGVYDKAADLRKEAASFLRQAEDLVPEGRDGLRLEIKYLRWRMAYEENPETAVGLFNDLANTARVAPAAPDVLALLENIQTGLVGLGVADRELLRRFDGVCAAKIQEGALAPEELKKTAERFFAQGNTVLAKELFETYLSRFSDDKPRYAREALALAATFAYDDAGVARDPGFAEELYKKASVSVVRPSSSGRDLAPISSERAGAVFENAAQYRRAFNLELMGECAKAFAEYKRFAEVTPQDARRGAVYFRMGVLAVYGLRDIASAEEYFSKTKEEFPKDALAAAAAYQLGMLAQFKGESAAARQFYKEVISFVKTAGLSVEAEEIAQLAAARLKELEEKKEMPYVLRLFLEGALKKEEAKKEDEEKVSVAAVSLVGVSARPSRQTAGQPVTLKVAPLVPETGCMTPAYSYEWSGMLGGLSNIPGVAELSVTYGTSGLKFVFVAVTGPQGLERVGFCIIDVIPEVSPAAEPQEEKQKAPSTSPEPEKKIPKSDRTEVVSRALETFDKVQ